MEKIEKITSNRLIIDNVKTSILIMSSILTYCVVPDDTNFVYEKKQIIVEEEYDEEIYMEIGPNTYVKQIVKNTRTVKKDILVKQQNVSSSSFVGSHIGGFSQQHVIVPRHMFPQQHVTAPQHMFPQCEVTPFGVRFG